MSLYWELFSHCWVSSEGKSEAYNMANRSTDSTKGISRFMDLNPAIGKHFDKVDKANRGDDDVRFAQFCLLKILGAPVIAITLSI